MNYPQKNIVHGNITAGGNVHIGDIIYTIERDFKSGSILFLRLDKKDDTYYEANLTVKSKHSDKGTLASMGERWCENMEIHIPNQLFDELVHFQTLRRNVSAPLRMDLGYVPDNQLVMAAEKHLSKLLFDTFFAGAIGKACTDFIQLLEEHRIDSLLLAISADDENVINLPFEMVLPLLFPPKWGEMKKSLASVHFGLVRTSMKSLERFQMQGDRGMAAPLKMLFITALPENLEESAKRLQIEAEQNRLVQVIGALPKIVIEFLDNALLDELNSALHARQHDIVHISGHGAYLAAQNKGVLYFENEVGDVVEVSGAALGETLRQHACVKLLILSACETAIAGSEGGVTQQVADYGVPSIVAMRFAVTDEGAQCFTTELYAQLAKGLSLTQALAYARAALYQAVTTQQQLAPQRFHLAEWFTPVLYQNQWVGALIDVQQPYHLPDTFYPKSDFLKTHGSRLVGEGFIGRKRYLIRLRQAFRSGRHVCVHGLGGLGKTTLAEAFAHHYEHRSHETLFFRNGNQIHEKFILEELFVRFEEANPLSSVRRALKVRLDEPKTDVSEKLQLLIDHYLKGRKTILIFDNVEDVQVSAGGTYQRKLGSASLSAFLRHLAENSPPNCHLLFTTRYFMEDLADVLEPIALDKMGDAEQYRLLHYSEILRRIPLSEHSQVYQRLDGHPRAYEYLAALLKKDKTFCWQQVAQSEEKVFENLLLAKVFERLTEREQNLFPIAAIFIARTPIAALAAVSGELELGLIPILQSLHDWSLCFWDKENYFSVHRLTREWMKEKVTPQEKIKEWALTAGEYFKNGNATVDNFILAKDYFEIAEAWKPFVDITFTLTQHFDLVGHYQKAIEINIDILKRNLSNRYNVIAISNISTFYVALDNYDKAIECIVEGQKLNKLADDKSCKAILLNNIALIHMNKDEYSQALQHFEAGSIIQRNIQDFIGLSTTLGNMSQLYYFLNEDEKCLLCNEECLKIQEENDFIKGMSVTLNNLGQLFTSQGKYQNAFNYYQRSLTISEFLNFQEGISAVFSNLGILFQQKGDLDSATTYLIKSVSIDNEIGYKRGIYINFMHLSEIMLEQGKLKEALQFAQDSLRICEKMGIIQNKFTILSIISRIFFEQGDFNNSLSYLNKALTLMEQIGDMNGVATTLTNIGATFFKRNKLEEAIPFLMQAYNIFQDISSPNMQATGNYLGAIIERIGETKFDEIISKIQ